MTFSNQYRPPPPWRDIVVLPPVKAWVYGQHPEVPFPQRSMSDQLRLTLQRPGKRLLVPFGDCLACQRKRMLVYVETITTNGVHIAAARCAVCGYQAKAIGIAKLPLNGEHLPLWGDLSAGTECERCGSPGVEQHHWAPFHLFPDANDWPLSYLCRACHQRWHSIVTPNMGRRVAS